MSQVQKAETKQAKPKKSAKEILNVVVNTILVIAIILAAVCTYVSFVSASGNGVPNILGFELFSVQTDSMYPTLKPGDLVIDKVVTDMSALRPNDIITYWTVINGERVLNTHRINNIYDGGNYLVFETKGDNNSAADSLTVHESEVVGVYHTHISGVGKVLDYLQTSTGFLIVVVIPVAIFFLFHLVQFFRILFEYQNIKNRLKYQEELAAQGIMTDLSGEAVAVKMPVEEAPKAEEPPAPAEPVIDKAMLEAELREKLRAEMLAEMLEELKKQNLATVAAAAAAAQAEPQEEAPKPVEEEPEVEQEPEEIPEELPEEPEEVVEELEEVQDAFDDDDDDFLDDDELDDIYG